MMKTQDTSHVFHTHLLSLTGEWQMRPDLSGGGVRQNWFAETFAGDAATLPGTVDTNPRQPPASTGDLSGFTPVYPYTGAVWYQRDVEVPEAWRGKRLTLFLERCQWETVVWVDGVCQGTRNSLVAPHVYDLGDALPTGRHRLTIMVDNANRRTRMKVGPDHSIQHYDLTTEIKDDTKLNCGGHHLWLHNWNGILGRMELQANDPVSILGVDAYPAIATGEVRIRVKVANAHGVRDSLRMAVTCHPKGSTAVTETVKAIGSDTLTGAPEQIVEHRLKLASPVRLWDEFSASLYEVRVDLEGAQFSDTRCITFGMRELRTEGTRFVLNGRTVFFRGTLECFVFPLTGHPPMDVESWRKVLGTAMSYGINLLRFHLCCPPEAAFQAADELGFYFQVELPGTSCPGTDESREVEDFLSGELARLLDSYGNHPSFLTLSMGNEQLYATGAEFLCRHQEVLARKVRYGREHDPRHLYTSTSHPWTPNRVDDFFMSAWPVSGSEPLCGIAWSGGRVIDCSRFNTRPPETCFDYSPGLQGLDKPLVTHEVGQWAVYPDLREITRYHCAQRAFNYEIIREHLRERGLLEWANDFTRASGQLALLLYKEEIESALRTPGLSGFTLLDIHDFPGQGTSPVGILNALWESKGLTTPAKWRAFCGPVVPLARLPKRVWTSSEVFSASIDLANYGRCDVPGAIGWSLVGDNGCIYAQERLDATTASQGGITRLGTISAALDNISVPARVTLRVEMAGIPANAWDIWVYPDSSDAAPATGVMIATHWNAAAKETLRRGGCLLLIPSAADLKDPIPGTFTPVFWNPQMKNMQVSMTMGLFCDPAHPALAGFPTDFHSDWQWWDPVMRSCVLRLDAFPAALRPIVRVVDSFVGNRNLMLIFEAKVGAGRMVVCGADIVTDLPSRHAARQLRTSLLDYMTSDLFLPDVPVAEAAIDGLFNSSLIH